MKKIFCLFIGLAFFLFFITPSNSSFAAGDIIPCVSTFEFDLMTGAGSDPGKNWYSINGGAITNAFAGKKIPWKKILKKKKMKKAGDIYYTPITIVGPMVSGGDRADLLAVLNDWAQGKGSRWNSTLSLKDCNGQILRTVSFNEYIPLSYRSPSLKKGDSTLLEEEFTFKAMVVEESSEDIPTKGNKVGNMSA